MSRKHQSGEYQRNAKIVRKQVLAIHKAGQPAMCWRGGGAILPGEPFDVGHRAGAIGNSLPELAAEHRHRKPGCCDGNRREGGRVGAIVTNRTAARAVHNAGNVTTWAL